MDQLARRCRSVLAVCAHPDDESFGLGAVVSSLADVGIETRLLCFTHGESSTLGIDRGDLALLRADELSAAATVLGVRSVQLLTYRDGALDDAGLDELAAAVEAAVGSHSIDCLLVFDEGGITGHADHRQATAAALETADRLGLGVLAWALPTDVTDVLNAEFGTAFIGRGPSEIDVRLDVDRTRQQAAIECHLSQSVDNPVLWRRLALQGATESLRWLRPLGRRDGG